MRLWSFGESDDERKRGGNHVVVLGDLNTRVWDEEVLSLMGKYGLLGRTEMEIVI